MDNGLLESLRHTAACDTDPILALCRPGFEELGKLLYPIKGEFQDRKILVCSSEPRAYVNCGVITLLNKRLQSGKIPGQHFNHQRKYVNLY